MKWNKLFGIVSLMLLAVLTVAGAASALPTIDKVEVDGTTVFEDQTNRLDLEVGNEFDVDIWLTSDDEYTNVRVEAEITGYEHEEDDEISARTQLFDTEADATYHKKLSLSLPADADKDSYKLRIIVTDRNSDEIVQTYNLLLDMPRHSLALEDVVLYPESSVVAGQALLVNVRLENYGQKDEDDVRVRVSIPELGISATDYIEEIESGDEEDTEEMYMRIPATAKAGDYTVKVDVEYNDGHDSLSASRSVSVEAAPEPKKDTVVVQAPPAPTPVVPEKSMLRKALEGILLVLVGLLVIVAIILVVSKLSSKDE